jgi:hypothetical protein
MMCVDRIEDGYFVEARHQDGERLDLACWQAHFSRAPSAPQFPAIFSALLVVSQETLL